MSMKRSIQLTESVQQTHATFRVDRTTRTIHNAKFIGLSSPNKHGHADIDGTEYSRDGIKKSLGLYEGKQVYLDHPENRKVHTERLIRDLAGRLLRPHDEDDGGYADIKCNATPAGNLLLDLAESDPESFGLSHNADGDGRVDRKRRKLLIESMKKVRSVDVVTSPATTTNIRESQEHPVKTLKQFIEALKIDEKYTKLLEDEGMPAMDVAPPPVADAGSWRQHLANAITAVVQDEELDEAGVKAKVMAILKLMADEKPEEPKDPEADAGDEPTKTEESRELDLLRKKDKVRTLCESLKFTPTEKQVTLLSRHDEAEQKDLIASFKPATPAKPAAPRSNGFGPTALTESRAVPKDSAERAKFLKSCRG